jgi:hypothetical protein
MKVSEIITENMKSRIIMEAKPETLGDGLLNKLFSTYQQRDINDASLNKFENGMQVANLIFQFVGPNYLAWVVKQYNIDQYFFLHDLPEWKTTLEQFATITKDRRIPIEKDINRYQNIDQLRTTIDNATNTQQNLGSKFYSNAIAAIDQFVNEKKASWLYKSNDYSIYLPKTFDASNICSKLMSTTVCTIMNESHFNDYSKHGTLMYIITQDKLYNCFISKDGAKKKSEFADEKNNHTDYDLAWMLENFPALTPLIKKASTQASDIEVRVAVASSDDEIYKIVLAAIKQDWTALKYVPTELRDYDICLAAVNYNGRALRYVPKELRDYDIWLAAVKQNGTTLYYVPEKLRDYDMCLTAVKQDEYALQYVPPKLQDKIKAALNKTESIELNRIQKLLERLL